ncbi:MAG: hypothetical protein NTV94_12825 [Planctomycetota bacterium]|nr:hypothetical protein [Planctomycetota bacterium]
MPLMTTFDMIMLLVLGVAMELPDAPDIGRWVLDRELWGLVATIGLLMAFMQLALVLPAFPSRRESGRPTWIRALVSGFGLATVIAVPLGTSLSAFSLLDVIGLDWFSNDINSFYLMLILACGLGLVIAILIRRFCSDGVPLILSVIIAAFIAAALVGGLVGIAVDALNLLMQTMFAQPPEIEEDFIFLAGLGAIALSWIVFTPIMLAFKGSHEPDTFISKLASRLFIGTVIEVVATIPIDIMVRRRSSCHCSDGSFWALIIGLSAGFIVLGPVVVLLPLGRRFQRRSLGRCRACGFDMRGCLGAPVCPECGTAWAYQGPAAASPTAPLPEGNDPPRAG